MHSAYSNNAKKLTNEAKAKIKFLSKHAKLFYVQTNQSVFNEHLNVLLFSKPNWQAVLLCQTELSCL